MSFQHSHSVESTCLCSAPSRPAKSFLFRGFIYFCFVVVDFLCQKVNWFPGERNFSALWAPPAGQKLISRTESQRKSCRKASILVPSTQCREASEASIVMKRESRTRHQRLSDFFVQRVEWSAVGGEKRAGVFDRKSSVVWAHLRWASLNLMHRLSSDHCENIKVLIKSKLLLLSVSVLSLIFKNVSHTKGRPKWSHIVIRLKEQKDNVYALNHRPHPSDRTVTVAVGTCLSRG